MADTVELKGKSDFGFVFAAPAAFPTKKASSISTVPPRQYMFSRLPMALRIMYSRAQAVFKVTLMYLAKAISEIPSLLVAKKYRARNQ